MRDRVGMVDLAAFAIFDVTGPGALRLPPGAGREQGRRAGRPGRLHAAPQRGRRDPRRPHDHAARPRPVPRRDRRRHGHARQEVVRRPPADRRLGAALRRDHGLVHARRLGPAGARLLPAVTSDDVSHAGFPFGTSQTVDIGGVRALASRISYVGELGWEIYAPMEQGRALWDALWEAGQPLGVVAGRDRRLRDDRPAREGLPRPRRRARARLRPRRGRHGPADGQGRRVRRQGGLPRAAVAAAGGDPVHADASTTRRRRPASSATCSAASRSSPRRASRSSTPRAAARM